MARLSLAIAPKVKMARRMVVIPFESRPVSLPYFTSVGIFLVRYDGGMDAKALNDTISRLVDCWCDRRDLAALAGVLPAWLSNNGLTDGWEELAAALRTMSHSTLLPVEERDELKMLWIELDSALRNR
jgi:hypothetical protein